MAPEETETSVTFPIETAMNGGNGVQAVRSTSSVGLSIIYVEFGFGTNVHTARQIVNERLAMVSGRLPKHAKPQLAPISSIMGQILVLGMWSPESTVDSIELRTQADWIVRQRLLSIPGVAQVFTMGGGRKQFQIQIDQDALVRYGSQSKAFGPPLREAMKMQPVDILNNAVRTNCSCVPSDASKQSPISNESRSRLETVGLFLYRC